MERSEGSLKRGKPEEQLIRDYWDWRRGTLVREYPMVKKEKTLGTESRRLDAILILNGEKKWIDRNPQSYLDNRGLKEEDEVEFIQAKAHRLGMTVLGQALFSRILMNKKMSEKKWRVKSRRWIALCQEVDGELGARASDYGIDVVVRKGKKFVVAN